MKAIYPGHDVVSLFNSSLQMQALTRERTNRGLVMGLLGTFLLVVMLGLTLNILQQLLNGDARSVITTTTNANQLEPVVANPSQAVSAYIDAGPGYIGR